MFKRAGKLAKSAYSSIRIDRYYTITCAKIMNGRVCGFWALADRWASPYTKEAGDASADVRVDFAESEPDEFPHEAYMWFEPQEPATVKIDNRAPVTAVTACHAFYASAIRVKRGLAKHTAQRKFTI